jgi:pimeloyl-ACP methyl ester carboxylesterase
VQWDQRGAGRTFAKNGAAGLTRERLIADGIDLAERLHKRFFGAPLILLGHSWGSIIATGMAQQRPDLFAAYVGTGQAASWADTVQFQFDFLKRRYLEKGARTRLAALEAIGKPDPKNVALKQIVGALKVPSSEFRVPSSEFSVLSSQFSVLSSQFRLRFSAAC